VIEEMLLKPRAFSAEVAAESVLPTTLGTAAVAGLAGGLLAGEVGESGESGDVDGWTWSALGGAWAELAGAWVPGSFFGTSAAFGDVGPADGEDAEEDAAPAVGGVYDAVVIC
jgi:hypothetical protein